MQRRTFLSALCSLPLLGRVGNLVGLGPTRASSDCFVRPTETIQLPIIFCEKPCSISEGIVLAQQCFNTCDRPGDWVQFVDHLKWENGILKFTLSNRSSHVNFYYDGKCQRMPFYPIADHDELTNPPIKMRPGVRTVHLLADGSYGHFSDAESDLDAGQWHMLTVNAPRDVPAGFRLFGPIEPKVFTK